MSDRDADLVLDMREEDVRALRAEVRRLEEIITSYERAYPGIHELNFENADEWRERQPR